MDLDDGSDVVMHDGDVLDSTENYTQATGTSLGSAIKAEHDSRGRIPRPNTLKSVTPALKGAGKKMHSLDLNPGIDVPRPPKFSQLPYATAQTGLVYDVRMRFHVESIPSENDVHPEDPRRIHAIFEAFVHAGLAWREGSEGPSNYYMGRIDTRKVTKDEVRLVHTERHWDWVQSLSTKTAEELVDELQHPGEYRQMDSVYLSPSTPYCAALSAGGAIEACRAILLGKVKNVFAVIRPPGHHAEREDVKGFCFYDNVSIATKACQREFGQRCRKVFILDWDVHHGNGIQQANYDDPNVLYISLHVHQEGRFYPEKSYRDRREPYGDLLHCGEGAGLSTNVNIPWRHAGMGDADYIYAFQQIVMPIATEFDPDLVIIAAGFDAAEGDMLGGCHVTPAGYAHMTHMLMSLAKGRVAVCLEGGYNLDSIARSACAVGKTLMGEPPDRLETFSPTRSGVDDVNMVVRQQSKFWSSLYPKDMSARLAGPLQGERMHDLVRKWQATTLWEEHEMSPLFIHKEKLSKSFDNQVLATPNYTEERPLLVIMHDPPEVLASPDPRTGKIELHNTWLTDIVKTYVNWAVEQGFAVIDVNLPKHVTSDDDAQKHEEVDEVLHRTVEATHLLTYLWDNYIELNDSSHVFLMGTNTGHGAIINFIKANEERAQDRLSKAISFVEDVPLQSCKSPTNDQLQSWYYGASLVFVANEHGFWHSEFARKSRKRFGRLEKSEENTISDMLVANRKAVTDLLLRETEKWRSQRPVGDDEEMAGVSAALPEPVQRGLPPVGNFALSPRGKAISNGNFTSPNGRQARSPRIGSPSKAAPPIANSVLSPRQRPS
ncbi:hypothetical protein LTR36_000354 [Oleoguttula mirabilis]|uniref:Histone deacetylase n=1 Tax=Oleoguttula mirabilis TaxID=1507867 RepID=A0AAV9JYS8_9PEZI|nr:hypothetical protein LTR36_000354 [Oleoguttula mirabilis]